MILVYFSHHMILLLDYHVKSEAYRIFNLLSSDISILRVINLRMIY